MANAAAAAHVHDNVVVVSCCVAEDAPTTDKSFQHVTAADIDECLRSSMGSTSNLSEILNSQHISKSESKLKAPASRVNHIHSSKARHGHLRTSTLATSASSSSISAL